jgi:hypothetical protein
MKQHIKNLFVDITKRQFSFLSDLYGFEGPHVVEDKKTGFVTVYYQKKNLAIECIFDPREDDIDCKIAKIINGKIPEHFAVDSNGNLVRAGLARLLRDKGIRTRLFSNVSELSQEDRIEVTIEDFVRMLKSHAKQVLNYNLGIFEN